MRVSFYLERSCPEQRPRAALKPQEPHSSGPFTPGPPAPAAGSSRLASRGVVVVEPWQGQAAGAISGVGKAILTLYPPLRPLSHNVNPRDGAQDIWLCYIQTAWVVSPDRSTRSGCPQWEVRVGTPAPEVRADGVHKNRESSGAPTQATRQAARRGDAEQPRRCAGRRAGAHRRGEDSPLTRSADLMGGVYVCVQGIEVPLQSSGSNG
jgi:hypothetical protein